jgi:hypothetical protein
MTRTFVATLALRMAGIYALFQAIYPTAYLVDQLVSEDALGRMASLQWLISAGLWLAASVVLLRFAPALGALFAKPSGDDDATSGADPRDLQLVAFRLLGAYGTLMFGPRLAEDSVWLTAASDGGDVNLIGGTGVIASSVGLTISFVLLFGARGLSGLIERMRGVGLEKAERPWTRS